MRDTLNELDSAVGDGDTGITMAKGALGVRTYLTDDPPLNDLAELFTGLGLALNKAAPSSLGTLLSMALLQASKVVAGRRELDGTVCVQLLRTANQTIQEMGKAKPGDKTVVDALHPATEAFAEAVEGGRDLKTASEAMLEAARAGRDAATSLRGKVGRSGWIGERTENKQDPGTVVMVHILEAILRRESGGLGGGVP